MLVRFNKFQENWNRFFNQPKKSKGNHNTFVLFKTLYLQWFRYILMLWNLQDYNIFEVTLYNILRILSLPFVV